MGAFRWGIAGFGWVARDFVAPAMASAGHVLAGIADPDPAARDDASARGIAAHPSLEALLAAGIDALYVATPNHRHRVAVEAAASRGVPVLCEKPLAATLADADAIASAVRDSGIAYRTAFDQRHHPAHAAIRDAIRTGRLGRVTAVRIVYACWLDPAWSPDRPGRGAAEGRASGATDGRAFDATDGRASGVTDGRASGVTDGRASGVVTDWRASGVTDGHASGVTEGRASGATDAGGRGANWRTDPAQAGGGALIDLAPHGVDLASFLLDEDLVALAAVLQRRVHDYPVDDGALLAGATAGGVLVSLHVAYNHPDALPRRRLEIVGTEGLVTATDTMGQEPGGSVLLLPARAGARADRIRFDADASPFARQVASFATLVAQGGRDPDGLARDLGHFRLLVAAAEHARCR